jgi:hypothetical protein
MEDLVVRHWVADQTALQGFQNYIQICQTEFLSLANELQETLLTHYRQAYPYRQAQNALTRFLDWVDADNKDCHWKLRMTLYQFVNDHMDDRGRPTPLASDDITTLRTALSKDLDRLPGHLRTLTKELLLRADGLASYLQQAPQQTSLVRLGTA